MFDSKLLFEYTRNFELDTATILLIIEVTSNSRFNVCQSNLQLYIPGSSSLRTSIHCTIFQVLAVPDLTLITGLLRSVERVDLPDALVFHLKIGKKNDFANTLWGNRMLETPPKRFRE